MAVCLSHKHSLKLSLDEDTEAGVYNTTMQIAIASYLFPEDR